jgi:hypothetical protein
LRAELAADQTGVHRTVIDTTPGDAGSTSALGTIVHGPQAKG